MPRYHMKITLELPKDGDKEFDVTADGRDIRAYEQEFGESFLTKTDYSQLCKVGYRAMKRLGSFRGSWETFDGQCIDFEEVAPPEPEDPTPTEPGDD